MTLHHYLRSYITLVMSPSSNNNDASNNNNPPNEKQDGFQVDRVNWKEAENELRTLRELIFIREQKRPPRTGMGWQG